MQNPAIDAAPAATGITATDHRNVLGSLLFIGLFLFFWISISPFFDLTLPSSASINTDNSSRLNQILFLFLPVGCALCAMMTPMRGTLMQPLWLLVVIGLWLVFVSLVSNHSFNSLKALFLTYLVMLGANACLILPRSEEHFGKLLAIGTLACLGLCYYGIRFLPALSIHSAMEVAEPMHAGLWRGYFPHKNNAAAAMVLIAFCGIFVMSTWSRLVGVVIIAAATWFLMHTGGKTASAMLPGIIILAFIFERFAWLRIPIAVGGVAAFNLLAIGSALSPTLASIVKSIGIDPTFTNRADIWRLASNAIAEFPLTGFGLKSFWRTQELVYGGDAIETWAIQASHAHNSYVEIVLIGGFPALLLSLILIFVVPLRNFAKLSAQGNTSHATRLFLRVWLYLIFSACLESVFYESSSGYILSWFMFTMAIFGMQYEANASKIGNGKPVARGTANG